uniref:2-oxoacid dehydrogenase acyltransferase catalytic domain-containing protein n=1 Tax=Meloidogyne floridensis TaxID=298350 RepID=A0A915P256_9BILA
MIFVNPPIIRFPTFSRGVNLQHSPISSILIGPAVKLLLLKYNLNLENIKKKSGPKSNILKSNQLKLFSSVDFPIESFVIYSCAQALKSVPEINVFWNENNYLQKSTNINISILDENKIPIIFNFADKIGLEIIAKLLKENKNLKEEMKRTFNIFNLSKLNISKFTSIITPPQTSILTIGSSNESLNLTLCYDARAIQEEDYSNDIELDILTKLL